MKLRTLLAAAPLALMLAGCFGGGDDDNPAPMPPPPAAETELPDSATASTAAFAAFAGSQPPSESAEPVGVDKAVPPTSETEEPVDVI
jgi:hypothetical protein